jgi:hypothetical protein
LPVIAVGALSAYYRLFTFFAPYDDEGYLLVSLAELVRDRALNEDVYTQYGPFDYLLLGSLFELLGRPVPSVSRWPRIYRQRWPGWPTWG